MVKERHVRSSLSVVMMVICLGLIAVLGADANRQRHQRAAADAQRAAAEDEKTEADRRRDLALLRAQLIIESSDVALIVCDKDGVVTAMNAAAEALLGWDNAEVVGKHSELFVPESMRSRHTQGLARARERLKDYDGDWLLTSDKRILHAIKKDGTEVEAIASVRAIKYGDDVDFILQLLPEIKPVEGPLMLQSPERLSTIQDNVQRKSDDWSQYQQSADAPSGGQTPIN